MKNKLISFVCMAITLMNLLPLSVSAEGVKVTVGTASGSKGQIVEVPVMLSGNTGFSDISIEINYDDTALKLTKTEAVENIGPTFTEAESINTNPYNMNWTSMSNSTYNGTLVTLFFEIISDTIGTYPVTVSYFKGRDGNYTDGNNVNFDENWNSIHLDYVDGSVTITAPQPKISITGTYPNYKVALEGASVTGTVYAALYQSNGALAEAKHLPAADTVDVSFTKTGTSVKIMWWNGMEPVCQSLPISLQ